MVDLPWSEHWSAFIISVCMILIIVFLWGLCNQWWSMRQGFENGNAPGGYVHHNTGLGLSSSMSNVNGDTPQAVANLSRWDQANGLISPPSKVGFQGPEAPVFWPGGDESAITALQDSAVALASSDPESTVTYLNNATYSRTKPVAKSGFRNGRKGMTGLVGYSEPAANSYSFDTSSAY